jgi:hypothetical protein
MEMAAKTSGDALTWLGNLSMCERQRNNLTYHRCEQFNITSSGDDSSNLLKLSRWAQPHKRAIAASVQNISSNFV